MVFIARIQHFSSIPLCGDKIKMKKKIYFKHLYPVEI